MPINLNGNIISSTSISFIFSSLAARTGDGSASSKDSDSLSNHPLGEKNFLIPITEMKNTNSKKTK